MKKNLLKKVECHIKQYMYLLGIIGFAGFVAPPVFTTLAPVALFSFFPPNNIASMSSKSYNNQN